MDDRPETTRESSLKSIAEYIAQNFPEPLNEPEISELYDWAVILSVSEMVPAGPAPGEFYLVKGLMEALKRLVDKKYGNIEECWQMYQALQARYDKNLTVEEKNQLDTLPEYIQARLIHYQDDLKPIPQAASVTKLSLPKQYVQVLVPLEFYQKAIAQQKGVEAAETEMSLLEISFLLDRCYPFLMISFKNSTDEKALNVCIKQIVHLMALAANAGFKRQAIQWGREVLFWLKGKTFASNQHVCMLEALNGCISPQKNKKSEKGKKSDWRRHQDDLAQCREKLRQAFFPKEGEVPQDKKIALKTFNEEMKAFAQGLLAESQALLGTPPVLKPAENKPTEVVTYCVMGLGSLSRGMLSAYSDMEYAVILSHQGDGKWEENEWRPEEKLLDAKQRADYVRAVFEIFEFKIRSLGEPEGVHTGQIGGAF